MTAVWFDRSMPWPDYDPQRDAAIRRLGRGLRRARTRRGLSQAAAAARCGISQSTISRLENGVTAARSIRWLARLFDVIDAEAVYSPRDIVGPDEPWMD